MNRRVLLIAAAFAAIPGYLMAGYDLLCKACSPDKPKYRLIDDMPKPDTAKPVKPATPGIKKRNTTRGLHSHICRVCRFEFWHVSGSHYCPRCGKGPWYTINQGESLNTQRGLFR